MGKRLDIHRPGAIDPENYVFVGVANDKIARTVGGEIVLSEERRRILEHMRQTGGTYSNHEHGGTCHCCGASAVWLGVFYCLPTNDYIKVGINCAEKIANGEADLFRTAKRSIQNAFLAQAGKRRAQATLEKEGLIRAWEIWQAPYDPNFTDKHTICRDIVGNMIRYGDLSDRQLAFLRSLVHQIDNAAEIEAQRQAEKSQLPDVVEGTIQIEGVVLSTRVSSGPWGDTRKMLVKTSSGSTLYGTIPGRLDVSRGDAVRFTAKVVRADKDRTHGYFSRPRKAEKINKIDYPDCGIKELVMGVRR